ncbi:MAG TPA: hypothetical protein VFE85_02925, partial [Woeseiaceae bacterium]|nr:hypothetical protein [Woeseiaceae bacterium]
MTKPTRRLLIGLLSLCLAATAATCWLLYTESGARWAWSRVEAALGGRLGAAAVAGTLSQGLTLTGLDYRDASRALSVDQVVIAIDADLFPTRVVVGTLVLDAVVLRDLSVPSAASADGPPPGRVLAALRLPFPLELRHAAVHGIERVAADGSRSKLLDTLEVSGRLFESLDVDALQLRAPGVEIGLHGGLGLAAPFAVDPGTAVTAALTGDRPIRARATFDGTLADLRFQVTGDTPSLRLDGSMTLIGGEPAFALTAQSPRLGWPLQDPAATMALEDLRLEASGWLTDYAVSGHAALVGDSFGRFDAQARAHGNLERLAVDALQLSSPALA